MTSDETLLSALRSVEVNKDFTEAVLRLQDHSRLCLCHHVDERWAKTVGPKEREQEGGEAEARPRRLLPARWGGTSLQDIQVPGRIQETACRCNFCSVP